MDEEENNSGFHKEAQFEMLLQELHNFQHTIDTTHGPKSLTDLVAFSNHKNSSQLPQQLFNRLLQDFQELENSIFPQKQTDPMYQEHNSNGYNLRGMVQNPQEPITNERTNETPTFSMEGLGNFTTKNSLGGAGSVANRVTRSDVTYNGRANDGSGGRMEAPFVKYKNESNSGMVSDCFVRYGGPSSSSDMGMGKRSVRRKRRYRGVYETEAEAILKHEHLKIQRRLTSAKAYQRQKEYVAHLQAQVQKLQEQNNFLNNTLMSSTPTIELQRKPLKRTMSGPIQSST